MNKLSVVTIVKDDSVGLSRTYQSLVSQTFRDWQMIIVVGDSVDSSFNLAQNIALSDKRVRSIRQTNHGIYEAMNIGIDQAEGEYLWFMNSGDVFANKECINEALALIVNSDVALIIGGYRLKNLGRQHSFAAKRINITKFLFTRKGGCHQSMLFETQEVRNLGGYSTNYRLASDFDLIVRILKSRSALRVPNVFSEIEPGGRADLGIRSVYREKHEIRQAHFNSVFINLLSTIWTYSAIFKGFLKKHLF